jgi:ribonuclease HI
MSGSRVYVKVPFAEKDEAKALGAKWDPRKKKWWFPAETTDIDVLTRWGGSPPTEKTEAVVKSSENIKGADYKRSKTDTTIRGWFDGGSRGNPGICGYGAVLRNGDGTLIRTESGSWKKGTNNEAEHMGCIAALRLAHMELNTRISSGANIPGSLKVEIYGDSQLVINQATGKWQCKTDSLKQFILEEHELVKQIKTLATDGFTMEHVYREDNKDADALANLGMDQMS